MPEANFFLQANNFKELFDLLRKEEIIEGSNAEILESERVIADINKFRKALREILGKEKRGKRKIKQIIVESSSLMSEIKKITREDGLRITVAKLAVKENL